MLDGVTTPYTTAPMEKFEVDLMHLEVGEPSEVVVPDRPAAWALLKP